MCALVVTHKMSPEADRCLLCVWGIPGKFFLHRGKRSNHGQPPAWADNIASGA